MRKLYWAVQKLMAGVLTCGFMLSGYGAVMPPTNSADNPVFKEEQGLKSADRSFKQSTAVSNDVIAATTMVRSGPEGIRIYLRWQDGVIHKLTIHPFDETLAYTNKSKVILKNAGIEFSPGQVRNYVRPNLARYPENVWQEYVRKWDNLPSPLAHCFPIAFRMDTTGPGIWLDGRYAGRIDHPGKLKEITFEIMPGSALGETVFAYAQGDSRYMPLDIARLPAAAGLPENTRVVIKLADSPDKAPIHRPLSAWLDVGQTYRELKDILGRSSFDGLKDSILVTVPAEQYIRAWMLCAVDDDPKKEPVITARLTRFVDQGKYSGRGRDAIADVTVKLPRGHETPGPGMVQAGSIISNDKTNPVWLVEVPLDIGPIQDLLWDEKPVRGTLQIGPYLDFELLGKLPKLSHPFGDERWKPEPNSVSGVKVLALTLEKTPVEMEVRQTQPGNIFNNDEKPELPVVLRPIRDGEYILRWNIQDVDGQKIAGGETNLSLKASEGEQKTIIPLQQSQPGWYGIDVELWQGQRQLIKYPAAFALLGPDTRQAGFESPYSSWWFGKSHYGTADIRIAGPLLNKLGFRRVHINQGVENLSEEMLAPWKVTDAMIGWVGRMKARGEPDARIEDFIRDRLQRFPHINSIMIFHESANGSYQQAPELIDLAATNDLIRPGKTNESANERWQQATWAAELIRAKFPNLNIIIGNSLGCSELIAEGLRRGFPEEYADYIGNETVNRTALPEKLTVIGTQCFWLLREIARKYGYNWQVCTCFEYNYRLDRLIGQKLQAEWYVRDNLIALAYRSPYISTALLYDTGNNYQNSFWGGSGLCRRYPLLFPKKAYVGMAVLTRVLDRAQLQREFPTGSYSIYALEFNRPDGRKVYAIWASRGTGALKIEFSKVTNVEVVDMYGRIRKLPVGAEGLELIAGTAAQYLITPFEVRTITCGKRTYPDDLPPDGLQVVNVMNDPAEWEVSKDINPMLENARGNVPYQTRGNYIMRGVKDDEKGDCLEVELAPNNRRPALMSEYAMFRLKKPVTVLGKPTTIGIWVKGNSGWGQICWEIEGADGVRQISHGFTDYDGRISINFDGWNFLSFPLTDKSPIPDLSVGSVPKLWLGPNRDNALPYPIKITGIAVVSSQQALYLTEMRRVKQVLRLKDLSVCE